MPERDYLWILSYRISPCSSSEAWHDLYGYPPRPSLGLENSFLDVPIIHIIYDLYSSFHELALKFPKSQRYSLGATIQEQLLVLLEAIIGAASIKQKEQKLRYLQHAATKVDTLRLLIRLCKDCKCLSNKQYLELESKLHEAGKMLGGWIKSIN